MFEHLRENPDMQDLCIDGTYIKAHRSSAGAKKGLKIAITDNALVLVVEDRSTKIHAVVDGLGYPIVLELTGGEVDDGKMLKKCLEQLNISGSTILADKAYGSKANREYITSRNATFCIPPKSNAVSPWYCDFHHYKERHLVEVFFMKIKDFRRIATRFDKLASSYLAFVFLAAALLWLA